MFIVIHYSEIGTKGKNRIIFEKRLAQNILEALPGKNRVLRRYGRIIAEVFSPRQNEGLLIGILEKIPGIANFSFAEKAKLDIADIKKKIIALAGSKRFSTFSVSASRSNKSFLYNSSQISVILGDLIRKKLKKKVDLEHPDLTFRVEVGEKEAFIYCQKQPGISGLPVGISGKAVVSLSGGIDSPVASFMAMKRGLRVVLVHFFNDTLMGGRQRTSKIRKIAEELAKFQGRTKLCIVPFSGIQKVIIRQIPADYRMIIYRRFMMRIISRIGLLERAEGIVTGDSVGQVASQTLPNLGCIYRAANLPVLPPLIGMNKEEIIGIAKKIGTYDISITPYPDCCSFMIAKHPETNGQIYEIEKLEGAIKNKNALINKCVKESKVEIFD
ncbi:MAG: tRNA 4-thiouridine(8) synthase ThiI [Candidatus Moranbacteria bacterium]|nr:tRNA 4-thiouridine(8) synthase ThiI [Candidatus Moranbacteria bacterium]